MLNSKASPPILTARKGKPHGPKATKALGHEAPGNTDRSPGPRWKRCAYLIVMLPLFELMNSS